MSQLSLTGKDVLKINNRLLNDLADGDCVHITLPNDSVAVKIGKEGNAVYALNEQGRQTNVEIRALRGGATDKQLNSLYAAQLADFASTILINAEFIKRIGDGAGGVTNDTYIMGGGVIPKLPEATSNAEGNTDQSLAIWSIIFTNRQRAIG